MFAKAPQIIGPMSDGIAGHTSQITFPGCFGCVASIFVNSLVVCVYMFILASNFFTEYNIFTFFRHTVDLVEIAAAINVKAAD